MPWYEAVSEQMTHNLTVERDAKLPPIKLTPPPNGTEVFHGQIKTAESASLQHAL